MGDGTRLSPRQRRAEETVDVLLEAAAQVLDGEAEDRFTTNHVAERAGYSIGTLYRYFADKRALARQLALRELSRREAIALDAIAAARTDAEAMAAVARALISPFDGRHRVRRRLFLTLVRSSQLESLIDEAFTMQERVAEALEARLVALAPERYRRLSALERTTLVGAMAGAVRATVMRAPQNLSAGAFETTLCALIQRFFEIEKTGCADRGRSPRPPGA